VETSSSLYYGAWNSYEGIQGSKFSSKVPAFEDEQQAKYILTKPYCKGLFLLLGRCLLALLLLLL
jgi:hypothetical protein